jgi:adenylate cyclase
MEESIACYAKAAALAEADYLSAGMMMVGYQVLGEAGKSVEAALMTRERTEKVIAVEPDNGSAMGYLVTSLIILGEVDSAKAWMQRALLLDPDNMKMRYNFCCDLVLLEEHEAALDMLAPIVQSMTREHLNWMNADPDLDPIRETARFRAILAEAEAVVAGTR